MAADYLNFFVHDRIISISSIARSISFPRLSLWETKSSNYSNKCYIRLKKFRSGDRRRHLKLDVTVCAACHRSHAHFLSATSGLEYGSIMDVDMHGGHVVCDVATRTDFDLFSPETAAPRRNNVIIYYPKRTPCH